MLSNPEVQRQAQQELDNVLGHGRLPNFDDEDTLPYVSALMREVNKPSYLYVYQLWRLYQGSALASGHPFGYSTLTYDGRWVPRLPTS